MAITYKGLGKTTRLGNQMFYYSTLRSVGIRLGFDIKIPKRKMDLLSFNIKKDFLTSEDQITNTYTEPSYSFSDKVFDIKDNTNLVGHFKSNKYFDSIRHILLKEFTLDQCKMNFIDSYIEKIRKDYRLISVHVRHGDYVNHPDVHPYCPISYYQTCINYFESKFGSYNCKFIIFSDDIPWCKDNLNFSNNHFCELNDNIIELLLMTKCDHNIIANSTFGWWGAYLNINNNKVFYPDKWFGENSGTGNLIPESWDIVKF